MQTFLILSISNHLLCKEWATITPNKYGKPMGGHRFARVLDDVRSKSIVKEGLKSITDEIQIRKFRTNIPDIIKKSITLHLSDDMTYNDIVTKSEHFEAANRDANAEHAKTGYPVRYQGTLLQTAPV